MALKQELRQRNEEVNKHRRKCLAQEFSATRDVTERFVDTAKAREKIQWEAIDQEKKNLAAMYEEQAQRLQNLGRREASLQPKFCFKKW